MKLGFIGLGTMGQHMALNLQKSGFDLFVHDLNKESAVPHISNGAIWADSPQELAKKSDVVFTSLPGPVEMRAVALGECGLIHGLKEGSTYFDLSTNSPNQVRDISNVFKKRGIFLLDAPVSGGPRGAETGKLALWVGGEENIFKKHKTLLDSIGDEALYVGPIGSGSIAKLVHNCSGYMIQTALAEVFTMGVKAGLEPLPLWEAVRKGSQGRRRTYDGLSKNFLPGKFDPPNFALKLAHKDVFLATELAREIGVPMRLANLTLSDMTEALNRGWGDRDSRSATILQQERSGVEIKVSEKEINAAFDRDPPLSDQPNQKIK